MRGSTVSPRDLTHHLTQVERHYARLFEDAPELSVASGNLVFTGVADDPATLATLQALGFQRPEAAAETVRGWHFGRRAAVRSARAREVLTELTPALLEAFAGSGDADAALSAFDEALARMPASVELLSILRSNASLARIVRRRAWQRPAAGAGDRDSTPRARRRDRSVAQPRLRQ